nr:cobalamin biosynthesis protein [Chthonobacter rhizosphaerae]
MPPPLLAVGLGCRSGVSADAVVRLVEDALSRVAGPLLGLFTMAGKEQEPALSEAAVRLGLPLVYLPRATLQAVEGGETRSERVVALFGVPSVAEAAALAGAGAGARLVVPRITAEGVTCAVAAAGITLGTILS